MSLLRKIANYVYKMNNADVGQTVLQCLRKILSPIVKFCIRRSLTAQDLNNQAKSLFVELGIEELEKKKTPWNISRLSVLTGIRRQEVINLRTVKEEPKSPSGILTRAIGKWVTDPRYRDTSGVPRILSLIPETGDFHRLVNEVSRDVSPASVLKELLRKGIAKRVGAGLQLIFTSYVPQGDAAESFQLLSDDLDDIINVVEENVFGQSKFKNHHATTEYTNIDKTKINEIKAELLALGKDFHQKIRELLTKYDLEKDGNEGVTVSIGTFSRISEKEKEL